MNRWRTDGRPLIIAHRGHSSGAPEQTRAAYTAAARLRADMIEADVRRSRDGRLVMLHDATLDRTTNGHGPVADVSFAELRSLDAGGWFSPRYAGEPVPSLDELFDLADQEGVALCLEAKGESAAEMSLVACAIAARVAARGRLSRDVVASFDHAALADAAREVPGLSTAPDRLPERGRSVPAEIIVQANRADAAIVQHHHADLSAAVVDALHAAGLAVWAWPTTAPHEVERALAMGVDAVMGDDVEAMTAVIHG